MPQKRQYHIMYAIDNFVYVLGGKEDNTCTNIVYKYDCDNRVWHTSKTHLFEAVRSPAHACIKKKIYLLGGFSKDNKQSNLSSKQQVPNPFLSKSCMVSTFRVGFLSEHSSITPFFVTQFNASIASMIKVIEFVIQFQTLPD
jgi:hypothetical protein